MLDSHAHRAVQWYLRTSDTTVSTVIPGCQETKGILETRDKNEFWLGLLRNLENT